MARCLERNEFVITHRKKSHVTLRNKEHITVVPVESKRLKLKT